MALTVRSGANSWCLIAQQTDAVTPITDFTKYVPKRIILTDISLGRQANVVESESLVVGRGKAASQIAIVFSEGSIGMEIFSDTFPYMIAFILNDFSPDTSIIKSDGTDASGSPATPNVASVYTSITTGATLTAANLDTSVTGIGPFSVTNILPQPSKVRLVGTGLGTNGKMTVTGYKKFSRQNIECLPFTEVVDIAATGGETSNYFANITSVTFSDLDSG